jgi:hypothetical protein
MAKNEEVCIYHMKDADLKQKSDLIADNLTRDIEDFTAWNVTADTITAFRQIIATFDAAPTDEELEGDINDATDAKYTLGEQLRVAIRKIRNMSQLQYNGKGKYNNFGFEDMANISDNELYRLAKRVMRTSARLADELALQGFTPAQLTTLTNLTADFDASIDVQQNQIEDRALFTQQRIMLGNILYMELRRLCSIGKSLYEDSDEAKYNDYVIDEGSNKDEKVISPAA